MIKNGVMKLNLQHFAEPPAQDPPSKEPPPPATTTNNPAQQNQAISIDYDKLSQIVQGKQSATEETVLKGYFKNQGLSKEEADQAIATFKQQKAASQPNVDELQTSNKKYLEQLKEIQVTNKAMLLAGELGIEIKSVPYIAKLADLSSVFGEDGGINEDKLKESFNKVLEDVPGFKVSSGSDNSNQNKPGFQQIGGSGQQQTNSNEDLLKGIFGIKK